MGGKNVNLDIMDGETALGEVDSIEVLLFDWPVRKTFLKEHLDFH